MLFCLSSLQYYSTNKSYIKIWGDLNEILTMAGRKKVGDLKIMGA